MGLLGLAGKTTLVQFIQNSTSTVIQLDASLKEVHSRASTPTKNPVENGETVSDHVIVGPFMLELTGIITDSPIGGLGGILTEVATSAISALIPPVAVAALSTGVAAFTAISKSPSPSVAAYNQLLNIQASAQPFDILTSLYRYPNMWISNLSVPRDSETGNCLIFTVSLEQLLLVAPQSVNIQVLANPGLAANQGDLGQQGSGIPNGFQQGFSDTNSAIKAVVPGGIGH